MGVMIPGKGDDRNQEMETLISLRESRTIRVTLVRAPTLPLVAEVVQDRLPLRVLVAPREITLTLLAIMHPGKFLGCHLEAKKLTA